MVYRGYRLVEYHDVGIPRKSSEICARWKKPEGKSYNLDIGLNNLLSFVMFVLLLITALSTLGLVCFSVTRCTTQIGFRRALGTSKDDIGTIF